MRFQVIFTPEAEAQLEALYEHIAAEASPATAKRFTDAIVERCLSLNTMPQRGTPRDDIRPGFRTLSFRKRAMIVYAAEATRVSIVGVFYGGQDFEAMLREDE